MKQPTFDEHGYPTEETLQLVETWTQAEGWEALFEFIRQAWREEYGRWQQVPGWRYRIATGGWSGNESLVEALRQNSIAWGQCWFSSERGGLHVFQLPEKTPS